MPPQKRSDTYFDGWYADQEAAPLVSEIKNRHLGLPPHLKAGIVAVEAIEEIAAELRLSPGDRLLDLACGRGGVGLEVARRTGARLTGVDFSAEAVRQASEQAGRLGYRDAEFQVGDLTASGLPSACADAVMCTDSIMFARPRRRPGPAVLPRRGRHSPGGVRTGPPRPRHRDRPVLSPMDMS
jgi:SAM-dependent methyltransferase